MRDAAPSWPTRGEPYRKRRVSLASLPLADLGKALLLSWAPDTPCLPHDHGGDEGWILVLSGELRERRFIEREGGLEPLGPEVSYGARQWIRVRAGDVHAMRAGNNTISLHLYQGHHGPYWLYPAPDSPGDILLVPGDAVASPGAAPRALRMRTFGPPRPSSAATR